MSLADLADASGYTKRNTADMLTRAGVLSVRTTGNRFYYSLARRPELEAFVGEFPAVQPNWTAMLNVAHELVVLERRVERGSSATFPVHVQASLRRVESDLLDLGIGPLPERLTGADLWPAVQRLGQAHLGAWSVGQWAPSDRGVGRRRAALPP